MYEVAGSKVVDKGDAAASKISAHVGINQQSDVRAEVVQIGTANVMNLQDQVSSFSTQICNPRVRFQKYPMSKFVSNRKFPKLLML